MIKAGEVVRWEPQWVIPIYGRNGSYICKYVIDFKVFLSDGTIELVEIKGVATQYWRLKLKLTKDLLIDDERTKLVVIFGKKHRGEFMTTRVERYYKGKKL